MNNQKRNNIFVFLFACFALVSCIDDLEPYLDDVPAELTKGYSLQLVVTLDNFGGISGGSTRATGYMSKENPMKEWENYIDPEKFRVLFFNDKEQFLFESKSRWVKQLNSSNNGLSQWLVSIPMFSYGNDIDYDWDWDAIREEMTKKEFRIAILANRPIKDFSAGYSESGLDGTPKWIDNRGPYWKKNHTSWGAGVGDTIRTVFDLHHCQYDPLYHAKSAGGNTAANYSDNFYDFIMGDYDLNEKGKPVNGDNDYINRRPKMGATVSFLYWGKLGEEETYKGITLVSKDSDYPNKTQQVKYTILPDKSHPIPMYGIQKFNPIGDAWIKGTPFNLSQIIDNQDSKYTLKSISLLRSVVKLELCIRKDLFNNKKPPLVTLWYPNIYSRCEPMDVWTPTEELWKDHETECEWIDIMNYGLFSSNAQNLPGGNRRNTTDKSNFQKILSWYYGVWGENGPDGKPRWEFKRANNEGKVTPVTNNVPSYPHIFNTCIQRNKAVICNEKGDLSDEYDDDYWHYIVYTGERNMIDPNKIPDLTATNYAISWMFKDGRTGTGTGKDKAYYFIPIANYNSATGNKKAQACFGPYNLTSHDLTGDMKDYAKNLYNMEKIDKDEMPWPLLRNHHYKIIIDSPSSSTRTIEEGGLTVQSENLYSESLRAE